MGGSTLEAEFELSDDELNEGARAYAESRGGRRALVGLIVAILALLVMGQLVIGSVTPGAWLLAVPLLLGGLLALPRSRSATQAQSRAHIPWKRRGAIRFDDEGVRLSSDESFSATRYPGLAGWLETKRCLVLHDRFGLLLVVPKGAFAPEDLPAVRARLDAGIVPLPGPTRTRRSPRRLVAFLLIAAFFIAYALWLRG